MKKKNLAKKKGTKVYYVYRSYCRPTGKYYIGRGYGYTNSSYLGSGVDLKRAIEKYGKHRFDKQILATSLRKNKIIKLERHFLNKYDAKNNKKYYNRSNGSNGSIRKKGVKPWRLVIVLLFTISVISSLTIMAM
jgi:hypothetical protein